MVIHPSIETADDPMLTGALSTRAYREEEGGNVDETHNPFLGDEALFEKREVLQRELQKKMTRRDGTMMSLSQSKRASELQKDMNAWEENRMFTSGVARAREVCLTHAMLSHPGAGRRTI